MRVSDAVVDCDHDEPGKVAVRREDMENGSKWPAWTSAQAKILTVVIFNPWIGRT